MHRFFLAGTSNTKDHISLNLVVADSTFLSKLNGLCLRLYLCRHARNRLTLACNCWIVPWSWQALRLSHMCFVQSFKSPLNSNWLEVAELQTQLCSGFDQQILSQVLLWLTALCKNLVWEISMLPFYQKPWSTSCFILGHNMMSHFS